MLALLTSTPRPADPPGCFPHVVFLFFAAHSPFPRSEVVYLYLIIDSHIYPVNCGSFSQPHQSLKAPLVSPLIDQAVVSIVGPVVSPRATKAFLEPLTWPIRTWLMWEASTVAQSPVLWVVYTPAPSIRTFGKGGEERVTASPSVHLSLPSAPKAASWLCRLYRTPPGPLVPEPSTPSSPIAHGGPAVPQLQTPLLGSLISRGLAVVRLPPSAGPWSLG